MMDEDRQIPNTGYAEHDRFSKIQLLISVLAGLPVVIICLVRGETLFTMALWTSVAIIIFWLLGNIARYYLQTQVFPPPPEDYYPDEMYGDEVGEEGMDEFAEAPAMEEAMAAETEIPDEPANEAYNHLAHE